MEEYDFHTLSWILTVWIKSKPLSDAGNPDRILIDVEIPRPSMHIIAGQDDDDDCGNIWRCFARLHRLRQNSLPEMRPNDKIYRFTMWTKRAAIRSGVWKRAVTTLSMHSVPLLFTPTLNEGWYCPWPWLQETYLKTYRFIDKYLEGTMPETWLFKILKNAYINGTGVKAKLRHMLIIGHHRATRIMKTALSVNLPICVKSYLITWWVILTNAINSLPVDFWLSSYSVMWRVFTYMRK